MPTGTPRNQHNAEQQSAMAIMSTSDIVPDRESMIIRTWTRHERQAYEDIKAYRLRISKAIVAGDRELRSLSALGGKIDEIRKRREHVEGYRRLLRKAEKMEAHALRTLREAEDKVMYRIQSRELG